MSTYESKPSGGIYAFIMIPPPAPLHVQCSHVFTDGKFAHVVRVVTARLTPFLPQKEALTSRRFRTAVQPSTLIPLAATLRALETLPASTGELLGSVG
mgnify:CR=1 FL=1|jgi:hypothetical protein